MGRCDDAVGPVQEHTVDGQQSVALLTPTGRDGDIAARILAASGVRATVCADMAELCDQIAGDVAALVIAEEALSASATEMLLGDNLEQMQGIGVPPVSELIAKLRDHSVPVYV